MLILKFRLIVVRPYSNRFELDRETGKEIRKVYPYQLAYVSKSNNFEHILTDVLKKTNFLNISLSVPGR
jgi:hypothetical protein